MDALLAGYLSDNFAPTDYTITGNKAVVTGTLDARQLRELTVAAIVVQYDTVLAAGVLTLQPALS